MTPLILHTEAFWLNPWDCSAFVALREKGLDFATAVIVLREGMGVVVPVAAPMATASAPMLQHGDFWLAESQAIVEYVEEAFAPPAWPRLLPVDLQQRGRARQVMSWLRSRLAALQRERPTQLIFYPEAPPPLGPEASRAAAALLAVAERLGCGPSGRIFAEPAIVDVELAFALMRLVRTGHPVPDAARAYAEAVWARPSVRAFVDHPRPPNPPWPTLGGRLPE